MNFFENLNISISGNPIILVLGLVIILTYTFFIYRTTLPITNLFTKGILIFIRALALFLLFLLLFDPIINLVSKEKVEPVNLIFVDNSKSVKEISSTDEISKINSVVNSIYTDVENTKIFTFADKVNEHNIDDSIYFSGKSTQFDNIFKELKSFQNVASAIIISDGINNQGEDPTQEASNLGFPIFTIGLGDTTSEADVKVEKITSNEFIYAGRETEIEVVISNNNLTNKKVNVQLSENQKLIVQKEIVLSSTEINRVRFPYSSEIEGEHKLLVNLISNENEKNKSNNSKIALVNVLATKKKITIIAGSPSADLSIVKSSLNKNEDYNVTSIVQLNSSSYANNRNDFKLVEEADILFLIGFPNENSSPEYVRKVANEISKSKKATFIIFSLNLDFTKLGDLNNILPFKVSQISNTFKEIQVKANDLKYSLLGSGNENLNEWEKLPPINLNRSKYIPSIESQVLLEDNIAKQPILFSKSQNGSKIIVLTAANFWKWKLQTANKQSQLFENLLINSVKWLGLNNDDQKFTLTTPKQTYKLGEKIIFSASYYDDTFEPINNASIEVNISNGEADQSIPLTPLGNGLYEAEFSPNGSGSFKFSATSENVILSSNINNTILGESIELETFTKKSDRNFLKNLSYQTNGRYYVLNNVNGLNEILNLLYNNKINVKSIDNELRLSFLNIILLFIILLFAIEWIIRKVLRML